jgi:hypothetical protein
MAVLESDNKAKTFCSLVRGGASFFMCYLGINKGER